MRTLLLLLLTAALPGFAANTTLYVNTANTGLDSGHTCLTNETDDSADSACTSMHAAESKLPADMTTGGDQGVWTITGVARTAPWDSGADEYAPSVGRRKRLVAIQ